MKLIIAILPFVIAHASSAQIPLMAARSIDRIADGGHSAFGERMVFATMTITNPTDSTIVFFPEGYQAQVSTTNGWTYAPAGNQCFTGIKMATIPGHGHADFTIAVWTTNDVIRIGQTFTINPDLTKSEDEIRSAHNFFSNIVWSTEFRIEKESGEPAGGAYVSPAAGDPSAHP